MTRCISCFEPYDSRLFDECLHCGADTNDDELAQYAADFEALEMADLAGPDDDDSLLIGWRPAGRYSHGRHAR